jgi:hypothetical protein
MADEDKLVKAGIEAALKPFADLLDKLAGPAAEEIGLTLKDHVRMFRFKRQIRLFGRVKDMLAESNIEPGRVPFKLLLPMVENASIEENDDLQDRWAAMLANAATNHGVHPSFPEILKQLSERDVSYLDATYEYEEGKKQVDDDRMTPASERKKRYRELDDNLVLSVAKGMEVYAIDADEAREKISLYLPRSDFGENVIRLGLMRRIEAIGDRLTGFGEGFVKACRPPVFSEQIDLD